MILRPVRPVSPSGTADHEFAGRIDVPHRLLGDPVLRQRLAHIGLDDRLDVVGRQLLVVMLGRHHDLGGLDRLAVLIADRHLALGVGPQRLGFPGAPRLRHHLENPVGIEDRRRHQFRGLAAGIAEHDALVAGAFILVAGGIDALGDVARLGMQMHFDRRLFPVEAGLLVADVLHREAGDVGDEVAGDRRRPAGLAGDHDAVGGRQRFAGDAHLARVPAVLWGDLEEGVHDLVGDAVADLVGMTFRNRFTGEQIARARHG